MIALALPEPPELKPVVAPQPDPFAPAAMIGAHVVYRVPSAMGWRVLRGRIVRVHDCGILVREDTFGGESAINAEWLVSYDWTVRGGNDE